MQNNGAQHVSKGADSLNLNLCLECFCTFVSRIVYTYTLYSVDSRIHFDYLYDYRSSFSTYSIFLIINRCARYLWLWEGT